MDKKKKTINVWLKIIKNSRTMSQPDHRIFKVWPPYHYYLKKSNNFSLLMLQMYYLLMGVKT